ncbi:MAG: hypothetical protein NTV02_02510 [Candidatus Zambryskibacteria bacterium]|nr:hypothetical protein [Candidatus Zambryskibacteria bacterium]
MMIFPIDVFVIIGIFIFCTLFTFFLGKSKGVSLLLSLFGAILLFQTFPFVKNLTVLTGAVPLALNTLAIFLAFTAFLYFTLNRYIVGDFFEAKFFKSAILGLAITALVLAIMHFVLPVDALYNFGPKVDTWFGGNFGLFWWIAIPLGILFFI